MWSRTSQQLEVSWGRVQSVAKTSQRHCERCAHRSSGLETCEDFEVLSNPPFPQPQGRHFPVSIVSNEWFGTQVSSCIASVETDMGFFDIRCSTPKSCFKIIPQSQHPNTSCTNHLKLSIELVDCLTLKRRDPLADRKTARRQGLHLTCVRVCARASPRATVHHHAQHEVLRVWQER